MTTFRRFDGFHHRRWQRFLVACLLTLLVFGGEARADDNELPASGPKPAPELAPLDEVIRRVMRRYIIPGATLGLFRDGRLILIRGYGHTDPDKGTPTEPDSQFRIASISKPITAAAILKLVEEGQLRLDDQAIPLVVEPGTRIADPRANDITIRQLLEHKGGWDRNVSHFWPMFSDRTIARQLNKPLPIRFQDIIRYMLGQPLDFAPGTRTAYSNFGYSVLGEVIEKKTGSYEQYVQTEILQPLGMHRTQLGGTSAAHRQPFEVKYVDYPGAPLVPSVLGGDPNARVPSPYGGFNLENMRAVGGWVTTASDLLRFVASASGARQPALLAAPPTGFVQYYPPHDLGFSWGFYGSLPGTTALVFVVNSHVSGAKTGFCVLMNSRPSDVDAAGRPVPDIGSKLQKELTAGIIDVLKTVKQWPQWDLFGSRFEPSEISVRLDYSGPEDSAREVRVPVGVTKPTVPIRLTADTTLAWLNARLESNVAPTDVALSVNPASPGGWETGSRTTLVVQSPDTENRLRIQVELNVVPAAEGAVVRDPDGLPLSHATVRFERLDGSDDVPGAVQTDLTGHWRQTGFERGVRYRAVASLIAHQVEPAEGLVFTAPATGLRFTAKAPYAASGVVTTRKRSRTRALAGVVVRFDLVSGDGRVPAAVTTTSDGSWKQEGFEWGTVYEATAHYQDRDFQPASHRIAGPSSVLDFETGEGDPDHDKEPPEPAPKPEKPKQTDSKLKVGKRSIDASSDAYKKLVASHGQDAKQILDHMIGAKGRTWAFPNSDALRDEVRIRMYRIQAARDLAAQTHGFSAGVECDRGRCESWDNFKVRTWLNRKRIATPAIRSKRRKTPSEALAEIFDPKKKGNAEKEEYVFQFDCANAQTIIAYKAYRDYLGEAAFNLWLRPRVEIGLHVWNKYKRELRSDLIPGDGFSFENPQAANEAIRNENTIYLGRNAKGERLFFGHPFGVLTEEALLERLNDARVEGAAEEARPRQHFYMRWPTPKTAPHQP